MRKFVVVVVAFALAATAVACSFAGWRNYRIFVRSCGTSDVAIRLDRPWTYAVTVDPPGRSLFRPGGVLGIFVTRDGVPVQLEGVQLGRGNLRVTDHTGHVCLEQSIDKLSVVYAGGGQYYSPVHEFETSGGGPYRIDFEITEPFQDLEDTLQTLSARHFVSGSEVALHYLQWGVAGLSGGLSLLLLRRIRTANKRIGRTITSAAALT